MYDIVPFYQCETRMLVLVQASTVHGFRSLGSSGATESQIHEWRLEVLVVDVLGPAVTRISGPIYRAYIQPSWSR